ncbi:hypothetical protein [Helicobacter pullorum]
MHKKAFIFADIQTGVGLGHFSRCTALLYILEQNNIQATLLDSSLLLSSYMDFELKKCNLAVIDSYVLELESYQKVANLAPHCIFFDDTLRLPYPKGILLNNSPSASKAIYQKHYPNHTLFLGSNYRLLQKPFLEQLKTKQKFTPKTISKILITLGGEDILNLTKWIITLLLMQNPNYQIHYIHKDTNLHSNAKGYYGLSPKQMANLFTQMDLCICACGQTLIEILSCKIPCIALEIAPNQHENLKSYQEAILAIKEVWNIDKNTLQSYLLQHLNNIKNPNTQNQLIQKGIEILNQPLKWEESLQKLLF